MLSAVAGDETEGEEEREEEKVGADANGEVRDVPDVRVKQRGFSRLLMLAGPQKVKTRRGEALGRGART